MQANKAEVSREITAYKAQGRQLGLFVRLAHQRSGMLPPVLQSIDRTRSNSCNLGNSGRATFAQAVEVCLDTALPILTEMVVLYLLIVLDHHGDC